MQISSVNGGAWVNPAAQNQQAAADRSGVHAPAQNNSSTEALNPLEESSKTQDRDANERYDGPTSERRQSQPEQKPEPTSGESNSILSLPADDNSEGSTLDLLG